MWKNWTIKTSLIGAALVFGYGPVNAQESPLITLTSLDGKVVMTGELKGFEAGHYRIVVAGLGLISIHEGLVTCQSTSVDCAALVSNS